MHVTDFYLVRQERTVNRKRVVNRHKTSSEDREFLKDSSFRLKTQSSIFQIPDIRPAIKFVFHPKVSEELLRTRLKVNDVEGFGRTITVEYYSYSPFL